MLRIVHPAPSGQGTDPPTKRRRGSRAPSLTLTQEEVRHVRAAVSATARAYGGFDVLALVMGVPVKTVYKVKQRPPSGIFAIRLAKAAGMSLEVILTGKLSSAGRCPSCGTRAGTRPSVAAAGGA